MRLSKKNQQLLFSLVALLFWIIFVPKNIGQENPNKEQNHQIQTGTTQLVNEKTNASDSATLKLEKATVLRVIDGDTIEIQTASGSVKKLRYIGINTPETVDPHRSVQCFGQQASDRNKELIANQTIYLEKDVSETDKYGRLLRYVYLETSNLSVNEQLVSDGYAVASKYPPDIKYQDKLAAAEKQAKIAQKGLWQIGVCPLK